MTQLQLQYQTLPRNPKGSVSYSEQRNIFLDPTLSRGHPNKTKETQVKTNEIQGRQAAHIDLKCPSYMTL